MEGTVPHHRAVRTGTEQLERLARWYLERAEAGIPVGFFQIGGGIAGDFPICVVPMFTQDLDETSRSGPTSLRSATARRQLRVVLGRGAEREDHLGQARRRHAEVHDQL